MSGGIESRIRWEERRELYCKGGAWHTVLATLDGLTLKRENVGGVSALKAPIAMREEMTLDLLAHNQSGVNS